VQILSDIDYPDSINNNNNNDNEDALVKKKIPDTLQKNQ